MMSDQPLQDRFGRTVNYVRFSVTDRCDFRCVYCMAEEMTFLPRQQVLTLEEIARLARTFTGLGTEKIRLTGGEPLVRKDILELVREIGGYGLQDFAMTTNGSHLPQMADDLKRAGLHRLNISLDSLDHGKFRRITRTGHLSQVLEGIDAAREAGFRGIKLNTVVMKGRNDEEIPALIEFARHKGVDISFIEEMPLGVITEHDRGESFCSSSEVRAIIRRHYELLPATGDSGGPARYYRMPDSDIRVGFISPIPTTSAPPATVCASPWKADCCSVSATNTRSTFAACSVATRCPTTGCARPSSMPWTSSRSATISPAMATCRSSAS